MTSVNSINSVSSVVKKSLCPLCLCGKSPIHKLTMPLLQRQQRPKLPIVIPPARLMLINQPLHNRHVSSKPRSRARRLSSNSRAGSISRRSQAPSGMPKPCFLRSMISSGSSPRAASFRDVLRARALQLKIKGNARHILRQLMIEEGRARLQRRRHAAAVGFDQQVIRQIRLTYWLPPVWPPD